MTVSLGGGGVVVVVWGSIVQVSAGLCAPAESVPVLIWFNLNGTLRGQKLLFCPHWALNWERLCNQQDFAGNRLLQ